MSVSSCVKSWHGATGSTTGTFTSSGAIVKRQYSARYVIKTTTVQDGPSTILVYCQPSGDERPFLGKEYRFGNDVDVTCFCTSITPVRDTKVGTLWEVTAEFTPITGENKPQQQPGQDGKDTSDPLSWAPKVAVRTTQISQAVDKAKFLGGMQGLSLDLWPVGTIGPVVNSAMVPYLPPLESERTIKIITFTSYRKLYSGGYWAKYQDALNTDSMTFSGDNWFNYYDTWEPFTARIKEIDGTFNYQNGVKFWEVTVSVHYDPRGWDRHILDQGEAGDCRTARGDDRTPSIGDMLAIPEVVTVRKSVGLDGIPITGPIPLNGNGAPLRNPSSENRVYLDYRVYYNEQTFKDFFDVVLTNTAGT